MTGLDVSQRSLGILDEVEAGIAVLDHGHRIVHWNACLTRLSGITPAEVLGYRLWDVFPILAGSALQSAVEEALCSGAPSLLSHALHPALLPLRHRDGRPLVHDALVRRFDGHAEPLCLIQVRDATERRHLQTALDRSRSQHRAVFELAAIGICEIASDGRFLRANDHLCAILGYAPAELAGRRFQEITHPDDIRSCSELVRSVFTGERASFTTEKRFIRKDGSVVWTCVIVSAVRGPDGRPDYAIAVIDDVSGRKETEAERERLLAQKDLLAREVHHRVKNSLALVASLLSLQNRKIPDPATRAQIMAAYRRVTAIAQVHDRLHRGSQVDRVPLGPFLRDLCADLEAMVLALERGQQVTARIDVDMELPVDQALPIAMVVSELVSNAFKHARPDGSPGKVEVVCCRDAGGSLHLRVRDDGVGLPPGFDLADDHGLGMRIVTRLSQQLHGRVEARNHGSGAEFLLWFDIGA